MCILNINMYLLIFSLNIVYFVYITNKGIFLTAEDLIYKLYFFFNVNNNLDLADKMKTTPQTISNWKSRNSINAINKKCRELGIYNDIFGDLTLGTTINQANGGRAGGKYYIENGNLEKEIEFNGITIELIKQGIEKFGSEQEFQFQLMQFFREIDNANNN